MLTPERHQMILKLLKENGIVKLNEFVEATNSSESTIRRDLAQLEKEHRLRRVHGGASVLSGKKVELSFSDKFTKQLDEKRSIAKFAAAMISDGESIYLDAGTTTMEMIPFITASDITVVTNGVNLIEPLATKGIQTFLIGGMVKATTKALIGSNAVASLKSYRFDKCFIGVNGIHENYGYTTPDPEEALVKQTALYFSQERFILADHSKFGEVSFAKIDRIKNATIITDSKIDGVMIENFQQLTEIKVVTS